MFSWRCFPFVESAPRAYRLKASNAAPLSSTSAGTFPVAEELDVGIDGRFELVIVHALAAGLVDQPHIRLESERDGKRIVRRALEREIAKFGKPTGKRSGVAVVEISHATDIVGRAERAELDLDELGGRELVLIFRFGRGIVAVAFAEPADTIDAKLLLALDADAKDFGIEVNGHGSPKLRLDIRVDNRPDLLLIKGT